MITSNFTRPLVVVDLKLYSKHSIEAILVEIIGEIKVLE